MKITLNNGTVIEIDGGEEIPAPVMQMIAGMPVTVSVATAPDEAVLPAVPDRVADEQVPLFLKPPHPTRGATRHWTLNPPVPTSRWPRTIYLTEEMAETFALLRNYPEGLTSDEIGIGLGLSHMIASGRVNRLRDVTPLVELVNKKYRMSMIGSDLDLKIEIARYPSRKNKKAGWERFMARPLPDGSGTVRR